MHVFVYICMKLYMYMYVCVLFLFNFYDFRVWIACMYVFVCPPGL